MRARTEEMRATAQRQQESLLKAEMKYRERMQVLEEQLQQSREKMRKSKEALRQVAPGVNSKVQPPLTEDESLVVAALSQWSGNGGTTLRVQSRSAWLGALTDSDHENTLWSLES